MQTRRAGLAGTSEIRLRELVKQSLRMRPSRMMGYRERGNPDTAEADGLRSTFTQTGTFVAVPLNDPTLPTYTGKVTIWGGFNANGSTVNGTFTFNLEATGSDGSTINTHQVDHFNARPDDTVNEFVHCH